MKINEEMKWRESMVKYAIRNGVSDAARKYRVNRQYVYRWKNRYTGDIRSLANHSTSPHSHPNQHIQENEFK